MSWTRLLSSAARGTPTAIAVLCVLTLYAYFGGGGSFDFRRLHGVEGSLYADLAEGFSRGHLSMASTPDPRLARLSNPYDPAARGGINYIWDASYLNGRYYLYFSPLPALIFYMPYRILRGGYPPDSLAGVVFSSWAFLAAVAFTYLALALSIAHNARPRQIPFALWVVFIGCGGVGVFVLAEVRIYEVSIMAGMAMTATWAYALVRFVQSPTSAKAAWMGWWLALAIAARPNLGILILVTAGVVIRSVKGPSTLLKKLAATCVPLTVIAAAMLWYNTVRFGKPGEFGHAYQLTGISMQGRAVCRLRSFPELFRFGNNSMHYVFWPLIVHADFPFVNLANSKLDPAVSFPGSEEVVGVAPLVPLTILGAFLALLFALRVELPDEGTRAAVYLMAGAWLIMAGLSTCWYVVVRYELDFMLLMTAATVICIEKGFDLLANLHIRMIPLRVAVAVLACYSWLVGLLLGFVGREHAFERYHPELFHRIAHWIRIAGI
ncbi:MAG TPA: hypothetical protein VGS96_18705 [Thermoanaerobaculia bacterium]|nr:hypothetical protein [Thermoanaerobaculia bacterium]